MIKDTIKTDIIEEDKLIRKIRSLAEVEKEVQIQYLETIPKEDLAT